MVNYLKRLFLGEKPVHFTWTPKNRIEVVLECFEWIKNKKLIGSTKWN